MKLYVDVSETYYNKLQTGIQRVVREVSRELQTLESDDFEVFFYVNHPLVGEPFLSRDLETLLASSNGETGFTSKFDILTVLIALWNWLMKTPARHILLFSPIISASRRLAGKLRNEKTSVQESRPIDAPDYLLMLDSFWGRGDYHFNTVVYFRELGTRVGLMIYDLIPLSHPEYVEDQYQILFKKTLYGLIDKVDDIFTISHFCRQEIIRILGDKLKQQTIQVVPLGSIGQSTDFLLRKHDETSEKPLILCVGTIEPRKNFEVVLDWWQRYGVGNYDLTIVGKPGWKTNRLQVALRLESEKKNGFRWLGQVSDSELEHAMSSSDIGIAASFVEGFGLPVLEMATKGLKMVLSDIPVFREIGPSNAAFFEPRDSSSLNEAIKKAKTTPWTTPAKAEWGDSALNIRAFVLRVVKP